MSMETAIFNCYKVEIVVYLQVHNKQCLSNGHTMFLNDLLYHRLVGCFQILLLEVYFFKKDFNPILSYGKYSYYKACLKNSNYKVDSVHQEVDYKKLWEFQKIEEQKYLDHYNCLQKYYTNCCWKFYFYCWNFKKLLKFRKTT